MSEPCTHDVEDAPDCQACGIRALDALVDQARRAALWDAVGEPAVALLREMVRFVDTLDARGPYELLPDIRALLASAEEQP